MFLHIQDIAIHYRAFDTRTIPLSNWHLQSVFDLRGYDKFENTILGTFTATPFPSFHATEFVKLSASKTSYF